MKELLKAGSGTISFVLIVRLCLQAESSLAELLKHRCAIMQEKNDSSQPSLQAALGCCDLLQLGRTARGDKPR